MSQKVEYLYAKELKKHYDIYGHFYELNLNEEQNRKCRSVLEIVSKAAVPGIKSIEKSFPDAIVIMMNPGSSSPKEGDDGTVFTEDTIVSDDFINDIQRNLVKTNPDPTQYQIMRLMSHYDYDHVRVINLSDLREPDSDEFAKIIRSLENDAHSIFSQLRRIELEKKMIRKSDAPIICAWGLENDYLPLAKKVQDYMDGYPIIGVKKENGKFLFGHARPRLKTAQQKWFNEVALMIDGYIEKTDSN